MCSTDLSAALSTVLPDGHEPSRRALRRSHHYGCSKRPPGKLTARTSAAPINHGRCPKLGKASSPSGIDPLAAVFAISPRRLAQRVHLLGGLLKDERSKSRIGAQMGVPLPAARLADIRSVRTIGKFLEFVSSGVFSKKRRASTHAEHTRG